MFTFYGDVSGSANTSVLTAAGFVATAEQWVSLERSWTRVLVEHHVSELHMRDYAHSTGEYEAWKGQEVKRLQFLSDLITVLTCEVRHSFASSVYMPHYKEVDAKYGLREVVTPLSLVGCTIVAKVYRWADYHGIPHDSIAFIFEDGDNDKGDFVDRCKSIYGVSPKFQGKKKTVAFQTADLLAYENFLAVKKLKSVEDTVFLDQMRAPFRRLSEIANGKNKEDWGLHQNPKLEEIYKQILTDSDVSLDAFVEHRKERSRAIRLSDRQASQSPPSAVASD